MSDNSVIYDPMNGQWSLSDGEHFLTVPHWARRSIADAYEREVAPLKAENDKLFVLLKHEIEQVEELRELVLHMYTCMGNVDADGNHECFSCEYEGAECDFVDRMRDLVVDA